MRQKITVLFLVVMLFIPISAYANGKVVTGDEKFKQEVLSAKTTKAVQQLAKQLSGPMTERKRNILLTYTGSWANIDKDFEKALLNVLLEDEYLAYDYRGYSYYTYEQNGKKIIDVQFQYYQTANQHKFVQQQVKKLVNQLTNTSMTEHEKVKVIHDYIVDNVSYDFSLNQGVNAPYFALKQGETLCNGYAMLMYIMLKEAKVDVRLISGSAGTGYDIEYHAWNMVELDGIWYQLDVTWNDLDDGSVRYDYYLVSDAKLKKDHYWWAGGLNGDEKKYPVAKANYFDQLIQEQNKPVLLLFDLWRDPQTTAKTIKQFEQLLSKSFNVLLDDFSIDYISRESYKVYENPEAYIEAAIAATGLEVEYTYEVEPYDYLNTTGVTLHIDVEQYSEDVADMQLANILQAGQKVTPKITMERTDGRKFDVTEFTTFTFDNISIVHGIQGMIHARAAGATDVKMEFDEEQFERPVIVNGQSVLQEAVAKPYPVEGYTSRQNQVTVASDKQWVLQTTKALTPSRRPTVRAFDEQGNEVYIRLRYADKKVIIDAPDEGYEAGKEYRIFIRFEQYPQQNSSLKFTIGE